MCSVADLTVTLLGTIDTGLARATQQAIALYARFSLLALNDVHFRLGIAYTSSGYSPAPEPPTSRWHPWINDLFHIDRSTMTPTPSPAAIPLSAVVPADVMAPDVVQQLREKLAAAPHASRAVVARLLTEAGTFLMGECVELSSQVETATVAGEASDRAQMTAKLDEAQTAARKLLDHALPVELEAFFFGVREVPCTPSYPGLELFTDERDEQLWDHRPQQEVWLLDRHLAAAAELWAQRPAAVVVLGEAGLGKTSILLGMARRLLFEKALSHSTAHDTCVAMAVSASNGACTDPVHLTPPPQGGEHPSAEPIEWLGTALLRFEHQMLALSVGQAGDADLASADPVARWMALIECLSGYAHPEHVLMLLDEDDHVRSPLAAVSPHDLVRMLQEDGLIPDLTGTSVTVVQAGAHDHGTDLHEHWLALCTAANARTCEFSLDTHGTAGPAGSNAARPTDGPGTPSTGRSGSTRVGPPRKQTVAGTGLVVPAAPVLINPAIIATNASIPGQGGLTRRRALARVGSTPLLVVAVVHVVVTVLVGIVFVSTGSEAMGTAALVLATASTSGILLNSCRPTLLGSAGRHDRSNAGTTSRSSQLLS